MDQAYLSHLMAILQTSGGARIEPGLTNAEVADIEALFGFRFPPDLRAVLQFALPVSADFPNWRGPAAPLRGRLNDPIDGVLFDVQRSNHWESSWGPRPDNLSEALGIATQHLRKAPPLIPVYSHRYLPSAPGASGNPVLSVVQTDIIYYGYDLKDYFREEFGVQPLGPVTKAPRSIPFWQYYLDANN